MTVKRIVANVAAESFDEARAFYGAIFGMEVVMDLGWIVTFASDERAHPQLSFAMEGGSGTNLPDHSIEVGNLDEIHRRLLRAGHHIEYGPVVEPWGVRRFFVRDPFGRMVNVLEHV